jgi:hypothetical protein
MPASPVRVGINGLGPLGRQMLRELISRVQQGDTRLIAAAVHDPELGLDPDRLASMVAREGPRAGPRVRVSAHHVRFGDQEIAIVDAPVATNVDVIVDGAQAWDVQGEAEALAAVFEPLLDAFGVRWSVAHVRRRREEAHLPSRAQWPQPGHVSDGGPLARELLERLPELAGKVEVVATVGLGPASSFDLSATMPGPPSLEQVLDRLLDAAGDGRIEMRTHRGALDQACGHPRVIVDGMSARAAGPLVRIAGFFDPLAVWARRVLDGALEAR